MWHHRVIVGIVVVVLVRGCAGGEGFAAPGHGPGRSEVTGGVRQLEGSHALHGAVTAMPALC